MNSSARLFSVVSITFLLLTFAVSLISAQGGSGSSDTSFQPVIERRTVGLTNTDVAVYALTELPDGKILVGGVFNALGNSAQNNIARLNADGTIDGSFNTGSGVNGGVQAIAAQPDGKIIVGGFFTSINGAPRNYLARLNSDGSVDTAFNIGAGADSSVLSVAIQSDGKIVIGGIFTTFNGNSRPGIARLNSDGTLDNTVTAQFNSSGRFVYAVALQADGRILVGGGFNTVNGIPQNGIARLNADGSLDASFEVGSGVNLRIRNFVVQPDNKILIVGDFTEYNGVSRRSIARLNPNGSLDTTFEAVNTGSTFNDGVYTAALQPDGKIIVGGRFQSLGAQRGRIARLNADGSLDTSFVPAGNFNNGFDDEVYAVLRLTDGKILAGGFFRNFSYATGFATRNRLARLNADGAIDVSFNSNAGVAAFIRTIAAQPDGKIIIGGTFDYVNGVSRNNIARLNADGSIDASFNIGAGFLGQGFTPVINAVAVQPDGKILTAGLFAFYDNQTTQRGIIRLNADGSRDVNFNLGSILNGTISAILLQPDGRILVGGNITSFFGREGVLRLNANGSTDTSFISNGVNAGGSVLAFARQSDGKILIGGNFGVYNGEFAPILVRVNANGTRDTAFAPSINSEVSAITIQSDGKIIVGGTFTAVSGAARNRLARLNMDGTLDAAFNPGSGVTGANPNVNSVTIQPNGKIIIGGNFTFYNGASRNGLARINADGTLDNSFNIGSGIENRFPEAVFATALQTDGKVLIGGSFNRFNGAARTGLARILSPKNTMYDFDADGRADLSVYRPMVGTWFTLNSGNNSISATQFGAPDDKLAPADYDGDGRTDIAVFRNGTWYLQRSQLGFTGVAFGDANDVPVPADYDADGKADIAVFRPSSGVWYLLQSTAGFTAVTFGQTGDKPVAADYDGDGKSDIAVNRGGTWYLNRSQLGFTGITFGTADDKPVPADYDGDGKTDVAVFRPSDGTWYLLRSQLGFTGITFGLGTDTPVPADYDGDGRADVAVFRNGTWYLNRSTQGFTGAAFGAATDKPIPNAFVP